MISIGNRKTPLISIVVPVYNRVWCLESSVKSIIQTNYPYLEIIIVDDGSTDGSYELSLALSNQYQSLVKVIHHPERINKGIAATRNLGIQMSQGYYLAFLDSDDLYLPNRFKHAITYLYNHPDLLGTIEPYQVISLNNEHEPAINYHLTTIEILNGSQSLSYLEQMLWFNQYWTMPVITVKREVFTLIGQFDTSLRFAEETALWLKLAATGKVACPQNEHPVAIVQRHDSHSHSPERDEVETYCNFMHVLLDSYDWMRHSTEYKTPDKISLLKKRLREYAITCLTHPKISKAKKLAIYSSLIKSYWQIVFDKLVLSNFVRNLI
ncbi:glycosyltransferase family 2 protein [Calothrix membranacea FACHB-236]|nr:glycosyltransferase family 2 protein [Calothrix membranacea FACHB-236]